MTDSAKSQRDGGQDGHPNGITPASFCGLNHSQSVRPAPIAAKRNNQFSRLFHSVILDIPIDYHSPLKRVDLANAAGPGRAANYKRRRRTWNSQVYLYPTTGLDVIRVVLLGDLWH